AYLGGVRSSEDGGTMAEAGFVVALDAASGAERWRAEVISADDADAPTGAPDDTPPSVFVNQPTVAAGTVFVGTVVDTPIGETTRRDPATNEEWVEIETETKGAVVALDAASGVERWRVETGGGGLDVPGGGRRRGLRPRG
ncbi:MAG: hypothetical protein M3Q10_20355, partial [Chloroflexota bacterium]|nr:hypothetical protein [Chloroflexota bacterium]